MAPLGYRGGQGFDVTGFVLSPGITPALVSAFSIEIPLAMGLAYVFFRNRGLEFAFVLNALALGVIKVYTDHADPYDMLVAAGTLLTGVGMLGLAVEPALRPTGWARASVPALGIYGIAVGAAKILTDPLDPFDSFLSASAIIAGAFLLRWVFSRPSRETSTHAADLR
jgi:hypothetical protein